MDTMATCHTDHEALVETGESRRFAELKLARIDYREIQPCSPKMSIHRRGEFRKTYLLLPLTLCSLNWPRWKRCV
jgi:hypothetical protein